MAAEKTILGVTLRRLIITTVNGMGKGELIRVTFKGTRAYTNGRDIVLPAIRDLAEIPYSTARALIGYAIHEVAHIRYTDFESIIRAIDAGKMEPEQLIKKFENCIEDYRIEREISREFPGATSDLTALRILIHPKLKALKPAWLADPRACGPLALTWTGSQLNGFPNPHIQPTLDAIPAPVRALIDNWTVRMTNVASTDEAVDLAIAFHAEAQAYANASRNPPQAQNNNQQQPDDQDPQNHQDQDDALTSSPDQSQDDDQPQSDDRNPDQADTQDDQANTSADDGDGADQDQDGDEQAERDDQDGQSDNADQADQDSDSSDDAGDQSDQGDPAADGSDGDTGDAEAGKDGPEAPAGSPGGDRGEPSPSDAPNASGQPSTDGQPSSHDGQPGHDQSSDKPGNQASDKAGDQPGGEDASDDASSDNIQDGVDDIDFGGSSDGDGEPSADGEPGSDGKVDMNDGLTDTIDENGQSGPSPSPSSSQAPSSAQDPASAGQEQDAGPQNQDGSSSDASPDPQSDAPQDQQSDANSDTESNSGAGDDNDINSADEDDDGSDPFKDVLDEDAAFDDFLDDLREAIAENPLPEDAPDATDGEVDPTNVMNNIKQANKTAPDYTSPDADPSAENDNDQDGPTGKDATAHHYDDKRFIPVEPQAESTNKYNELRNAAAGVISTTARTIRRLLMAEEQKGVLRNRRDGNFDIRNISAVVRGTGNCYKKSWQRPAPETHLTILGDFSGSMGGQELDIAMMGALAIEEATRNTSVTTSLYGYAGYSPNVILYTFKEGKQAQVATRRRIGAYRDLSLGCTPTGEAMAAVAELLEAVPHKRRILLVLTDGDADDMPLCKAVVQLLLRRGVEVVAIGIDSDGVHEWCPDSHVINDIGQLPQALLATIDPRAHKKRGKIAA